MGRTRTRYGWSAERSPSATFRVWVRHTWYTRDVDARRMTRWPVERIIRYLWPDPSERSAVTVAWCESRLTATADNPSSTATGVFQILGGSLNPWWNTRQALQMYEARGWQPWLASSGCWG